MEQEIIDKIDNELVHIIDDIMCEYEHKSFLNKLHVGNGRYIWYDIAYYPEGEVFSAESHGIISDNVYECDDVNEPLLCYRLIFDVIMRKNSIDYDENRDIIDVLYYKLKELLSCNYLVVISVYSCRSADDSYLQLVHINFYNK